MTESNSHRQIKNRMAGPGGKTEVTLRSGRRMDALSRSGIGTEVERQSKIPQAVSRLKEAKRTGVARGVKIAVHNHKMGDAIKEMRRQGVNGRVQNLSDSRSYYVGGKKSRRRS